jgi:hypothetical protein
MESKHPETYFNKLKLRIKLVKLKYFVKNFVYLFSYTYTCEQAVLEYPKFGFTQT